MNAAIKNPTLSSMKVAFGSPAAFFAVALLAGCDYIDEPLPPGSVSPPQEVTGRRVLIEDFTGHTCPNCPSATAAAVQLQASYGEENLIVVGIHVTEAFAAPVAPIGDGEFDTDFRTPAGDTYANSLSITFLPVGAINRIPFGNSTLLSYGSWSSAVADIIGDPASIELWFEDFTFNAASGEVNSTIGLAALQDLTGEHNLTVYLTEDSVVADQIDNTQTPSHVHDYVHRHVLRSNVNGTWGESIIAGSAGAGDTLTAGLNFTLPSNVLNAAHCSLVAYVYNVTTNEILQVAEKKF